MLFSIVSVAVGAALGALLRWFFSVQLNSLFPSLPPGTLLANLVGGYLIGVAVSFLASRPDLPPQWRLFIVTGFMGGLTTFSTFSAEVVNHLQEERFLWAATHIAVHVVGSVSLTLLGVATVALFRPPQLAGG